LVRKFSNVLQFQYDEIQIVTVFHQLMLTSNINQCFCFEIFLSRFRTKPIRNFKMYVRTTVLNRPDIRPKIQTLNLKPWISIKLLRIEVMSHFLEYFWLVVNSTICFSQSEKWYCFLIGWKF
jgi:hypothetical protein